MPFLFGILFFFASFQEEKVLSPFLGRGGSFYFYSSVLKRTRFLLCPPHPPPLFTHRRTGMGYNATATRFVRKNFVDQAGGNPSLLSIDLDQKLQEICVFLSVWGLFFSLRFELSSLYLCIHLCVCEGFQSFRWHQNDDILCWVGLRQNIGLSATEGGKYDNILNVHVMFSISMR